MNNIMTIYFVPFIPLNYLMLHQFKNARTKFFILKNAVEQKYPCLLHEFYLF